MEGLRSLILYLQWTMDAVQYQVWAHYSARSKLTSSHVLHSHLQSTFTSVHIKLRRKQIAKAKDDVFPAWRTMRTDRGGNGGVQVQSQLTA